MSSNCSTSAPSGCSGYAAADVLNKITPADISDPQELIARADTLSVELGTTISPGFDALVFKASRGIEDIYELTYIRKDGSRFPAIVSVTALRDDQGGIIGYLLIGTDNTARKRVEAEQQKLDQRLRDQHFYTRSLIESNIDALMTTDAAGIITDVNRQMEALTGCTRDELIGAPFKNYFTDPERAAAGIKLVLREKKVTNYELTARARDGKMTVVSYNATTFYDRDRTLQGVFAAARDITERKHIEQILQEKNLELEAAKSVAEQTVERLEEVEQLKKGFLSTVSHELRTPLTSIRGSLGLLASGAAGPLSDQVVEVVALAERNAIRLMALIEDILDLERLETGKIELHITHVPIASILRRAMESLAAFGAQGVTVEAPTVSSSIHGDADRIVQVLVNLLSNAVKFSPPGGVVDDCRDRRRSDGQSSASSIMAAVCPPSIGARSSSGFARSIHPTRARRAAPDSDWRSASRLSSSTAAASAWRARKAPAARSGFAWRPTRPMTRRHREGADHRR